MCADETQTSNHALFRDCLSGPIVHRSAVGQAKSARKRKPKGRKTSIKLVKDEAGVEDPGERDAEELADFVDVGGAAL